MRALTVLAGLTLLATPLMAQNPDFSGAWKVDTDKSDAPQGRGGGMMGMGELKITQGGGKLTMVMAMGERSRTTTYNLDGSESRNPGMRGNEMMTKSHWEGKTLVTEGENTFNTPNGDMTVKTREERSLSDDGKTMTVATKSTTPQGERTRKMVYAKQ